MTRHLTAVPPTEGAPSAPPDARHPMERAREALREAALAEADAFWAEQCRRFADAMPDRGP